MAAASGAAGRGKRGCGAEGRVLGCVGSAGRSVRNGGYEGRPRDLWAGRAKCPGPCGVRSGSCRRLVPTPSPHKHRYPDALTTRGRLRHPESPARHPPPPRAPVPVSELTFAPAVLHTCSRHAHPPGASACAAGASSAFQAAHRYRSVNDARCRSAFAYTLFLCRRCRRRRQSRRAIQCSVLLLPVAFCVQWSRGLTSAQYGPHSPSTPAPSSLGRSCWPALLQRRMPAVLSCAARRQAAPGLHGVQTGASRRECGFQRYVKEMALIASVGAGVSNDWLQRHWQPSCQSQYMCTWHAEHIPEFYLFQNCRCCRPALQVRYIGILRHCHRQRHRAVATAGHLPAVQ